MEITDGLRIISQFFHPQAQLCQVWKLLWTEDHFPPFAPPSSIVLGLPFNCLCTSSFVTKHVAVRRYKRELETARKVLRGELLQEAGCSPNDAASSTEYEDHMDLD